MKELVDAATVRAILLNADGATQGFYERLKQRQLQSTQCKRCQHVPFPPRLFCPRCGADDVGWVELPRQGTLYAFSQQALSLRFAKPDVLGLVQLPGCPLVLSRIDAPFEELSIGQRVEVDFLEVSDDLVLHQFRPV